MTHQNVNPSCHDKPYKNNAIRIIEFIIIVNFSQIKIVMQRVSCQLSFLKSHKIFVRQ